MLTIGDTPNPNIKLESTLGGEKSLADYAGKIIVLYFYPKDLTGGCTTQACSFRDANVEIKRLGAVVIGVSPDNLKKHNKFIEKEKLNFELWSDPERKLIEEEFDLWVEKTLYGRKYMGVQRNTYILDKQGKIIHIWEKAKPEGHAEEVLSWLNENQDKLN